MQALHKLTWVIHVVKLLPQFNTKLWTISKICAIRRLRRSAFRLWSPGLGHVGGYQHGGTYCLHTGGGRWRRLCGVIIQKTRICTSNGLPKCLYCPTGGKIQLCKKFNKISTFIKIYSPGVGLFHRYMHMLHTSTCFNLITIRMHLACAALLIDICLFTVTEGTEGQDDRK
jgi:hypothetical protein